MRLLYFTQSRGPCRSLNICAMPVFRSANPAAAGSSALLVHYPDRRCSSFVAFRVPLPEAQVRRLHPQLLHVHAYCRSAASRFA